MFRVLLVEDNEMNRDMLVKRLSRRGYEVLVATNGREGIDTPIDRATGSVSNQYGASGWRRAYSTKCSNCHSMVHGSDLPSQGISGRGGALTR